MLYEITVEHITPCGGEKYAVREIIEAEAESPMAYVLANKRFPNVTVLKDDREETVIEAHNDAGYKTRYTFTE